MLCEFNCALHQHFEKYHVIQTQHFPVGFGSPESPIKIYIANRPPIDSYPIMQELRSMLPGEIDHIVKHTSNHWRKVFNVYAKFLFDWQTQTSNNMLTRWQDYREQALFQDSSVASLLFSPPQFDDPSAHFHIVAGKTYAALLSLPSLVWIDQYFAFNQKHHLIVSPYPDYRQLSNDRTMTLITLMKSVANPT